jgi:hypothetical protein
MTADRGNQRSQMVPGAHQHGDLARRVFAPFGFDQGDDLLRLGARSGTTLPLDSTGGCNTLETA